MTSNEEAGPRAAIVTGGSRRMAHELRGRDISVNALAPGPTATALFLDGKDDEAIASFANAVPLERLGTPADIAEAVAFLTSHAGHLDQWADDPRQRRHQLTRRLQTYFAAYSSELGTGDSTLPPPDPGRRYGLSPAGFCGPCASRPRAHG